MIRDAIKCTKPGRFQEGSPRDGVINNALPADPPTARTLRRAGWSYHDIATDLCIEEREVPRLLNGEELRYIVRGGLRITPESIKQSIQDGLTYKQMAEKYHCAMSQARVLIDFAEGGNHEDHSGNGDPERAGAVRRRAPRTTRRSSSRGCNRRSTGTGRGKA